MKNFIKKFIPKSALTEFNNYKKRVKLKQFKGKDVFCPCCNNHFSHFLPTGYPERKNVMCPNCYSLERHRLLWLFLEYQPDIRLKKIKVLHFAPEHVFFSYFSQQSNIEYYPVDLFPDAYPKGTTKADITKIPFDNNFFDVIICNHVLEHIPADHKAMTELRRVLNPKGWAILQVPMDLNRDKTYEDFSITSPEARKIAFGQEDHVRWYGKDYKDRLSKAGFEVDMNDFVINLDSKILQEYRLTKTEIIYQCSKTSKLTPIKTEQIQGSLIH